MLRILRAFAWLRWRSSLNALERTGSRDTLARLSIASDSLTPLVVVMLMIPTAVTFAGISGYAGWRLAHENGRIVALEVVRFLLAAGCVLVLASPILFPARERPNAVRLLLLPIHRRVLYAAHALALLSHPMLLLVIVIIAALPLGLAIGGRPAAALLVAAAGVPLAATLAGLLIAVTSAAQLAVRDRRRGEWIALALFLLLPAIGLLPAFSDDGQRHERRGTPPEQRPRQTITVDRRVTGFVPSELYMAAVRAAPRGSPTAALGALSLLGAISVLVHGAGYALFGRVLASAGTNRPTTGVFRGAWRRIPGVPRPVSAVALNHVRLVFRTPRGRFAMLSPLVVLLLVVVFSRGSSEARFAFVTLDSGVGVAVFTGVASLLGTLPLAMNQFAIDRTGLTLMLLAPLDTRALLAGKALGTGVAAAIPAVVCAAGALALFPAGDPHLWLSLPLAFVSVLLLSAPPAAALSAMFPRSVDLSSISRGSNAHGVAGLLGTLTLAAAVAATAIPILVATHALNNPALAPVLVLAWTAGCAAVSAALLAPVQRLLDRRRESLAMLR